MTSDADRALLLRIAREAIAAHLGVAPAYVTGPSQILDEPGGAFVTLHNRGDLRGCIGHIEPNEPLGAVVRRCAVAACSADSRFPPITPSELADINIELSLLGPLERIAGPDEVVIGRHGVVAQQWWSRGLLLPQVAVEWRWDAPTFVTQTCRKAGLPTDAWTSGALLWRFEAEVFGEERPAGQEK